MGFPDLPEWERPLSAERHQRPVAILGRRDGFMTGIRQLRRTRPLETEVLTAAAPSDAPGGDLRSYKGLVAPWNDWEHLVARGRHWAGTLATLVLNRGGS